MSEKLFEIPSDTSKIPKPKIQEIDGTDNTTEEEYKLLDQIVPSVMRNIKSYPHAKKEGLELVELTRCCIFVNKNGEIISHNGAFKDSKHRINDLDGVYNLTFKKCSSIPYPDQPCPIGENFTAEVVRIDTSTVTIYTKYKGILKNCPFSFKMDAPFL